MTILTAASTLASSVLPPFSFNLAHDLGDMLAYDFMRTAFLAGTVVALVAGLIGYFVVLRQLTFASDALAHLTFAGALGAVVLGLPLLVGVFGLTIVAGLGIGALGQRARARDVAVGAVLAWVLGVGVLLLSLYTAHASASNSAVGVNVLFGSIFSVQPSQAVLAAIIGLGAVGLLLIIARPLLFASLDPDVAVARGVPVRALGIVFLILPSRCRSSAPCCCSRCSSPRPPSRSGSSVGRTARWRSRRRSRCFSHGWALGLPFIRPIL
jgi:zinc/manganese transport system permease protein